MTEASALTTAARSFAAADESLSQLSLPHFTENMKCVVDVNTP